MFISLTGRINCNTKYIADIKKNNELFYFIIKVLKYKIFVIDSSNILIFLILTKNVFIWFNLIYYNYIRI